ncbi:MAG: hypothetical protein WBG92_01250 [Thiohalocapsa sp.]
MTNRPDDSKLLREKLYRAAPKLGAALSGIETLAELMSAGITDSHNVDGEISELLTPQRISDLAATVGALASYAKYDLAQVIGEYGEDRLCWGNWFHLNREYLSTDREPDWRLREEAAA